MHDRCIDHPQVIARPPLIYLGGLTVGFLFELLVPSQLATGVVRWLPGVALLGCGAALMVAAMREFALAGTNVPTPLPALALVSSGPYRRTRNPIYIALALIHAGIAVCGDSLWSLLTLVPVMIVVHNGVVRREERYLEEKFGDDYRRYSQRTARWL